jgi:hypothetical protein
MRTRFELAVVTLALVAGGLAQTSRGTVPGTVADSSGAVIAGAQISLVHTQNGVRRSTVSNDAGIYRFDALDLGGYELKVEQAGFRRIVITENGVEDGQLRGLRRFNRGRHSRCATASIGTTTRSRGPIAPMSATLRLRCSAAPSGLVDAPLVFRTRTQAAACHPPKCAGSRLRWGLCRTPPR